MLTYTTTTHIFKDGKISYEVKLTESFRIEVHKETENKLAITRTRLTTLPAFHWLSEDGCFTHEKALEVLKKEINY